MPPPLIENKALLGDCSGTMMVNKPSNKARLISCGGGNSTLKFPWMIGSMYARYIYQATFTININQMPVNIPYMARQNLGPLLKV